MEVSIIGLIYNTQLVRQFWFYLYTDYGETRDDNLKNEKAQNGHLIRYPEMFIHFKWFGI